MPIVINSHSVWINVVTVHESLLEFVLHDAETRNGKDYGFYEEQLGKALETALKPSPFTFVQKPGGHGDLMYLIMSDTHESLMQDLQLVERAVDNWISYYRVNSMTRN